MTAPSSDAPGASRRNRNGLKTDLIRWEAHPVLVVEHLSRRGGGYRPVPWVMFGSTSRNVLTTRGSQKPASVSSSRIATASS